MALSIDNLAKIISLPSLGDIASIVGLFITLFLLYSINKIRNHYMFIIRVPKLIEQLKNHASKIIHLRKDWPKNIEDVNIELAKSEVILNSLMRKLLRKDRRLIITVLRLLKDTWKKIEY